MTRRRVEAVLFARYGEANFKALYGRLRAGSSYTKDYIQIRSEVANALQRIFGVNRGENVEVTYNWPNGSQQGHFSWSVDRYHLKWDTDTPPAPWALAVIPLSVCRETELYEVIKTPMLSSKRFRILERIPG